MRLFIKESDIYCKCETCDGNGQLEHIVGGWETPIYEDVDCEDCDGNGVIYFMDMPGKFDATEIFEFYDDRGVFSGFTFCNEDGEMMSYSDFEECKFHFKNQ